MPIDDRDHHHLIADHVVASLILGLDHLVHWISLLQAMSSALSSKVSFIDKISDHFDISLFVCSFVIRRSNKSYGIDFSRSIKMRSNEFASSSVRVRSFSSVSFLSRS